MIQAIRRITFPAGHRLLGHEGGCANLHGHNYTAEFYTTTKDLDEIGRVMDFGEIKHRLGGWIEKYLDHAFIVSKDDLEALYALDQIAGQKLFVMPCNPTAENIAGYLLTAVCPTLLWDTDVVITRVRLSETENCFVEVEIPLSECLNLKAQVREERAQEDA